MMSTRELATVIEEGTRSGLGEEGLNYYVSEWEQRMHARRVRAINHYFEEQRQKAIGWVDVEGNRQPAVMYLTQEDFSDLFEICCEVAEAQRKRSCLHRWLPLPTRKRAFDSVRVFFCATLIIAVAFIVAFYMGSRHNALQRHIIDRPFRVSIN